MLCCECDIDPCMKILHIVAFVLLIYGLWVHKIWLIVLILVIGISYHAIKKCKKPEAIKIPRRKKR